MSVAALASARVPSAETIDLEAWLAWLDERLVPDWRPGEWDAGRLVFTGALDNPRTAVWKCVTRACIVPVHGQCSMCRSCETSWQRGRQDRDEFVATFVPAPQRRPGIVPDACLVIRDGTRCGREAQHRGLCKGHSSTWRSWQRGDPLRDPSAWLAVCSALPYPVPSPCLVTGCPRPRAMMLGLCELHRSRWQTYCRQQRPALPLESWVRDQTPYLAMNQFSLAPAGPVLCTELLYGLQQRDERGGKVDPQAVRWAITHLHHLPSLVTAAAAEKDPVGLRANSNGVAVIREVSWALEVALERFRGIDPADKRTWDLVAVGVPSSVSLTGRRRHAGVLSFDDLAQPWLRDLAWEWARAMRPSSTQLRHRLRGCAIAAKALTARPGGGMDPATLQFADMTAVAEAFRALRNDDGTLMSAHARRTLQSAFYDVLDYGRSAGLLDRLSGSFTRHAWHRIATEQANEDEIGKAIPESVIRQLDAHLHLLGRGFVYKTMSCDEVAAMFFAAYTVLRDTGRRPAEVCSLRLDCIECENNEYSLIWDNRKGRRLRRRLPITAATAQAVLAWREQRSGLTVPARSTPYLFPAITNDSGHEHLSSSNLARAIRAFADAIPVLVSEIPGPDGVPLTFDRRLIYPYAFRHSYAQRHADAGVDLDVLRQLMDHRSAQTTLGYYQVSLKRKREAIATVRLHVLDRHGRSAPMTSNTAYEARSVAVPFGNCIEPSNVKAGGKGCPIRFQCAGCGFYRPDPSYLPAVEDHVRQLRADRETALAMDAADFVVRNLDEQVAAFGDVAGKMRDGVQALDPSERAEVEEASRVLRKMRAAAAERVLLPLTVLPAGKASGEAR
jgi:integrase